MVVPVTLHRMIANNKYTMNKFNHRLIWHRALGLIFLYIVVMFMQPANL